MATDIQPIGFLSSVGGNRSGLGENYVKKLEAAGRPSVNFTNDDFGGISDAIALINQGSQVPHLCVFRVVKTGDEYYAVPDYSLPPKNAAIDYKNCIQPELPKQVKDNRQHIWLLLGNELDDNRADWLGWWSYESALLWNQEGYKVGLVGWNSGEPEPEAWKTPGQVKYLTYCSQHPDLAAVNVHEYSFTVDNILDGYPYKVGRFQFLFQACDELGIPRVPLLIGEWGWTLDNVPGKEQARREIIDVANLYSQFPQILGAGIWYLGAYQNVANKAQRLIEPVGAEAARYVSGSFSRRLIIDPKGGVKEPPAEISPPSDTDSPLEEPEPQPITQVSELFALAFTGQAEKDVGIDNAAWYDVGNTQVPIINGRKMDYWEAEGKNSFAGDDSQNDFGAPEGVHRWDALMPQQEHFLLNEQGRCYHLFAPSNAWWVRFSHHIHLDPGTYRLNLDLWGDWVDIKEGKKQPKPDPKHAQVELFISDQGKEAWFTPALDAQNTLQREFQFTEAGEYDVGFGVLTVFPPDSGPGANGCFLQSFSLERVAVEEPAVEEPGSEEGTSEELSSMTEIARQTIPLPEDSEVKAVRLKMSQRSGEDWLVQKTITERLDNESQLEIIFLQEASDSPVDDAEPDDQEPSELSDGVLGTKSVTVVFGLNMRTGPSTAHNVITTLQTGTVVEILKEGAWDFIRVGGYTGYVSSQFLSSLSPANDKPKEVEKELPQPEPGEFRFAYWPTDVKRVNQHFGERPEFYQQISNGYLPAHEGIDLAAPFGTPYYCVAPGVVKRVSDKDRHGKPSPYGWHVLVVHDKGFSTLYAHATPDIRVTEGAQVSAGQILAYSGNTGNSSGPHLHLTLKQEGHALAGWPPGYMDPWLFLEPLFNALRPPIGNLIEGYLYARSLDIRGNELALAKLNLNLRERPDSNSRLLAKVPKGSSVRLLSEVSENGYHYCETGIDMDGQPKSVQEEPKPDKIDLLTYIKGDGRGRLYEVKNAWGSQERFQIQEDGLTFYLLKNTHWEQFLYDEDFIYRDVDTSPGSGRYYRLKDPDRQRGSRWLRRHMAVGETYTQYRRVQFYNKDTGAPSAPNSGHVTDTIKLVTHHVKYKFQTGLELNDVLELHWVHDREDHTPKEKYFYARGLGMVGWIRGHEDPNSPSWSAVSEIHEPGSREPFLRERVTLL